MTFGRVRAAEEELAHALRLAEENAGGGPDPTSVYQRTLARAHALRGAVRLALGRDDEAVEDCRAAIARIGPRWPTRRSTSSANGSPRGPITP